MDIKKKRVMRIILIIILIIIFLFLWLGIGRSKVFSRNRKGLNMSGVSEIAKPVFVVDGNSNIKIDGKKDTVYKFCVKNYDDTGVSNTDLRYFIQVVNDSEADLDFILTSKGKKVNLNNNKTGLIALSSSKKQTDEYELKIIYNNDPAMESNIDGNVQIKIEAVPDE